MITLNLLDPQRKKNYLLRKILLTIQKGIEILFFFILIIGIIFYIAEYYIDKNFQAIIEQTTFINQNVSSFNKEINQINYQLKEISNIQSEYIAWSPLLIEITNAIPEGVKLDSLKIDKNELTILMKGRAAVRNDFLILKNNLNNIYFIDKIESPLTNLLKKEDVDFKFTIFLDGERLTN